MKIERRTLSEDERTALQCLAHCTFPPASWDKKFVRDNVTLATTTEKSVAQIWRLFHRYRRQITHPQKQRLLAIAEQLAAPDFRKLNKVS